MAEYDYKKAFSCPKCGVVGNIYLVKVAGSKVIVKQRCPQHGGRQFKVSLKDKDQYIDFIKDGVFRCFKCGGEATQSYKRDAKPWTIIKTSCPTHGALTSQKIWSTIYDEISIEGDAPPPQAEPSQPEPSRLDASQQASPVVEFAADGRAFSGHHVGSVDLIDSVCAAGIQ